MQHNLLNKQKSNISQWNSHLLHTSTPLIPTTMHTEYLQYKSDDLGNPLTAKVCWSSSKDSDGGAPKGKPIGTILFPYIPLVHATGNPSLLLPVIILHLGGYMVGSA